MNDIGEIAKIYKNGKDFYVRYDFDNTYGVEKISLEEAAVLGVGQEIKITWEWNQNGRGIRSNIVRPIQIYKEISSWEML